MKVIGEWKNVNIQGKGTGFLRLEERGGHCWIALYEKLSAGDAMQEKASVAVDAIKENPEAAAGAALTAAASGAVKSIAAALGADRSAMRRIQVFENDSAKEFSKTFAESNDAALRKHLIFEKELSSLNQVSNSGNTVYMLLDAPYRLTFENPWFGENMSRELFGELDRIRKEIEASRIKQGIDWSLDANGLLTITGWGKMPDWDWNDGGVDTPWYARRNEIKKVHISDGFVNIGEYAFYDCNNLSDVNIPDSITNIGHSVFEHCTSLINLDIPNGVTNIGAHAFCGCENLKNIVIPNSVSTIGNSVFRDCANLTSIRIQWGVTEIPSWSFERCKRLSSIDIPSSVTSIGFQAFCDCENLTNIRIPQGVTTIEDNAFERCRRLSSIDIPNSVTRIGGGAFGECGSLSQIRIPKSVTKLGLFVFDKCNKLKKVEMSSRFDSPLFKLRFGISKDIVTFT